MLWKWKLARDADDVLHLLNGDTKYDQPVPDARICMTWRGDHPRFWVFAIKAAKTKEPRDGLGGWGWKVADDPDAALRFLRGDGPAGPLGQAQIASVWTGRRHQFYIFHRRPVPGAEPEPMPGDWTWKLTTDRGDVVDFLNGGGPYAHPVTTARIATSHRNHHDEYFVFSRRTVDLSPVDTWRWQAVDTPDDVRGAVERRGEPPVEFQVVAPPAGNGAFQVFMNVGEPASVQAVLTEECLPAV